MGFGQLLWVGRMMLIPFTIFYQFRFYIAEEVLESPCVVDIVDRVADGCFVSENETF